MRLGRCGRALARPLYACASAIQRAGLRFWNPILAVLDRCQDCGARVEGSCCLRCRPCCNADAERYARLDRNARARKLAALAATLEQPAGARAELEARRLGERDP